MKVKFSSVYKFIILFIVLVEYDYFKLIGLGEITRDSFVFLLMIMVGLICALSRHNKTNTKKYYRNAQIIVLVFSVCTIAVSMYTVAIYNSNIVDTLSVSIRWLIVFFIYPLLLAFEKEKKHELFLFNSIIVLGTVMYFFKTVIWYLYNFRGIVISPQIVYEYGEEWMRNNLFRIDDSSLMYLFLFSCIFQYRRTAKKKYIGIILIQILYSVFVTAARSSTVSILFLLIIYYLISGKNTFTKLKKYLIVGVGTVIIVGTTLFQNFIDSFRLSGSSSSLSSVTRLKGLSYYVNTLVNMGNPLKYIFGIGALSTNIPSEKAILRGPLGVYFIEDLGIVGFILQYCFVAVVLITTILIIYKQSIRSSRSSKIQINHNLEISVLMFCIFVPSIFAQCVFDKSRIVSLPFMLALILYFSDKEDKAIINN